MKFVSLKRDTLIRMSAKLAVSVVFLGMTTTIATAMADNIHIYEISEGSELKSVPLAPNLPISCRMQDMILTNMKFYPRICSAIS